jgi:hypothetical protein
MTFVNILAHTSQVYHPYSDLRSKLRGIAPEEIKNS